MENTKRERRRRVRRRRFLEDEVHHIYQRTINRFNIFYDLEDYLVYYTIFSIFSKKIPRNMRGCPAKSRVCDLYRVYGLKPGSIRV